MNSWKVYECPYVSLGVQIHLTPSQTSNSGIHNWKPPDHEPDHQQQQQPGVEPNEWPAQLNGNAVTVLVGCDAFAFAFASGAPATTAAATSGHRRSDWQGRAELRQLVPRTPGEIGERGAPEASQTALGFSAPRVRA